MTKPFKAVVLPRHSTPATSRSTLLGRPDHMVGCHFTCEERTGLAAEELLEAPIVDLWVTMRSSILSAVASVVAGMELMVLGMRRRSQWVPSQCCCTLAERCARPWEQSGGVACIARARCECQ